MRRRIDVRQADGQAMTEFALILPVFMLIVVGLLAFGRVFFYWIEANHLANETARWAIVDRNPFCTEDAAAVRGDERRRRHSRSSPSDVKVCIDFQGKTRTSIDLGDPIRVRIQKPFSPIPFLNVGDDHRQGVVDDADRTVRRQRRSLVLRHRQHRDVLMNRSLRSERGGVMVLAAVMIPVFLLLTALVFDVGDWYTHKRQLQNRADAAAFSAGIEYQKNWKACVQNGDPALKLATAQKIANAARQYAGDPQASDYAPATMPTPVNTELANQSKVDVVINSTSHTNDTDNSDGGGALNTVAGSPCYSHAADDISAAGYWTDVKVKEKDLPSLVGSIGLPLSQNLARARIEIRPATSGHRFLPLAVPDFEITRVQVRYFDECRDPNHNSPLATKDLAPLPVPEQHDYIASGGGTLWTLPVPGSNPPVGDKSLSFGLTIPVYQGGSGACGSAQYLPVGVEVRIASRDEVDFNQSCATLRNNVKFADCFSRLSQIRVYNDGNPDNQVRITNVRLSGGCPTPGDAYFATLPFGLTTCPYDVSAEVNWGNRDAGRLERSGELPRHGQRRRYVASVRKPDRYLDDVRRRSAGIRGREHGHGRGVVGGQEPTHEYPVGSSNKCKANGKATRAITRTARRPIRPSSPRRTTPAPSSSCGRRSRHSASTAFQARRSTTSRRAGRRAPPPPRFRSSRRSERVRRSRQAG